MKRYFALLLVFALSLSLVGCGGKDHGGSADLMEGISARTAEPPSSKDAGAQTVTDFGVRLVQNSLEDGKNLLISPLSVLCALAMTANGAEGETRAQMEAVFGFSVEELNRYLRWYVDSLPQSEDYALRLANSIWFTEDARFTPNQNFLQCNADYYGADIYSAPFDDSTVDAINKWVEDKTEGMIGEVLDEIPEEAVMYLVNALAFEAEWDWVYQEHQVRDGIFTAENGGEQDIEMMYSQEYNYLEDDLATGFVKDYKDRSYSFVALLPREGISVGDYITELTGERLRALLDNVRSIEVHTAMPKFESEYSVELSDILKSMGMTDAFDWQKADFSGLGISADGNISIGRVLHKTFISVGEQGTKAGAATVIEMDTGAAMPQEFKEVHLDRPFVYLLIDRSSGMPFFIGVMRDIKG